MNVEIRCLCWFRLFTREGCGRGARLGVASGATRPRRVKNVQINKSNGCTNHCFFILGQVNLQAEPYGRGRLPEERTLQVRAVSKDGADAAYAQARRQAQRQISVPKAHHAASCQATPGPRAGISERVRVVRLLPSSAPHRKGLPVPNTELDLFREARQVMCLFHQSWLERIGAKRLAARETIAVMLGTSVFVRAGRKIEVASERPHVRGARGRLRVSRVTSDRGWYSDITSSSR